LRINKLLQNAALTFATGCAATMTAFNTLRAGDHILCALDVYGGTYELVHMIAKEKKVEFDLFDVKRLDLAEKMMKPNTKVDFHSNNSLYIIYYDAIFRWFGLRPRQIQCAK
jgi:O-acetylhomoserine/O-acetylserine sulfhydrylase-like pyridoxal-dependent enzyme